MTVDDFKCVASVRSCVLRECVWGLELLRLMLFGYQTAECKLLKKKHDKKSDHTYNQRKWEHVFITLVCVGLKLIHDSNLCSFTAQTIENESIMFEI